jgi:hypothetical protein
MWWGSAGLATISGMLDRYVTVCATDSKATGNWSTSFRSVGKRHMGQACSLAEANRGLARSLYKIAILGSCENCNFAGLTLCLPLQDCEMDKPDPYAANTLEDRSPVTKPARFWHANCFIIQAEVVCPTKQ